MARIRKSALLLLVLVVTWTMTPLLTCALATGRAHTPALRPPPPRGLEWPTERWPLTLRDENRLAGRSVRTEWRHARRAPRRLDAERVEASRAARAQMK